MLNWFLDSGRKANLPETVEAAQMDCFLRARTSEGGRQCR